MRCASRRVLTMITFSALVASTAPARDFSGLSLNPGEMVYVTSPSADYSSRPASRSFQFMMALNPSM
jgi:hypothetical protein